MKNLFLFLFLTQLVSCQKKPTTQQLKTQTNAMGKPLQTIFKWKEGVNAPLGYPVEVYRGGFENGFTSLSGMGGSSNTWGSQSSGMSSGEKGIPHRIKCIWVAYAEDCEYEIDCDIDYDKMLRLFNEGFWDIIFGFKKEKDTYNHITVGFAPGGVVVVWLVGGAKQVEVGRYQGKKIKISQAEINSLDSHEKLLFDPADRKETMMDTRDVPLEFRNKPIPFGLWDTYRQKYSWRPTFSIQREGKIEECYRIEMFNAEVEMPIYEVFDENKFQKRAIIKRIVFGWWDKNRQGYGAEVNFDEKEIFEAFDKIYKDNKEGDTEIEFYVNMANTYLSIKLKGNGKEVPILKAKIEVFESREVTSRYKKQ